MFGKLFQKSAPSKFDLVMTVATAVTAVWKAYDTVKEYKAAQEEKENNA